MSLPKLLWVSDACVPTGFATVTHNILGWLGGQFDRVVLGINASGDPHGYPYPVYPARVGGDFWGFGRLVNLVEKERPDVILIQSDAWIVASYLQIASKIKDCPPIVGFMPIDGLGMKRSTAAALSGLATAVFYTQFGVEQAKAAGVETRTAAIGLGVRRELFSPMPKQIARRSLGFDLPADAFLFGNVNRNQPRKRLDLSLAYFKDFIATEPSLSKDCYLYIHCLREDVGWDLEELARYYGLVDRVFFSPAKTPEQLLSSAQMRAVYGSLDVQISTAIGEGWGLPTLEGMSCGIPQVVPEWAALAEWPRGAVEYVAVEPGAASFGFQAFGIGATPLREAFVAALSRLRRDAGLRQELSKKALELAGEARFEWRTIAWQVHEVLIGALARNENAKTVAA